MSKRKAIQRAKDLARREGRTFIAILGNRTSYVIPGDDLRFPNQVGHTERLYVAEPGRVAW